MRTLLHRLFCRFVLFKSAFSEENKPSVRQNLIYAIVLKMAAAKFPIQILYASIWDIIPSMTPGKVECWYNLKTKMHQAIFCMVSPPVKLTLILYRII